MVSLIFMCKEGTIRYLTSRAGKGATVNVREGEEFAIGQNQEQFIVWINADLPVNVGAR